MPYTRKQSFLPSLFPGVKTLAIFTSCVLSLLICKGRESESVQPELAFFMITFVVYCPAVY